MARLESVEGREEGQREAAPVERRSPFASPVGPHLEAPAERCPPFASSIGPDVEEARRAPAEHRAPVGPDVEEARRAPHRPSVALGTPGPVHETDSGAVILGFAFPRIDAPAVGTLQKVAAAPLSLESPARAPPIFEKAATRPLRSRSGPVESRWYFAGGSTWNLWRVDVEGVSQGPPTCFRMVTGGGTWRREPEKAKSGYLERLFSELGRRIQGVIGEVSTFHVALGCLSGLTREQHGLCAGPRGAGKAARRAWPSASGGGRGRCARTLGALSKRSRGGGSTKKWLRGAALLVLGPAK